MTLQYNYVKEQDNNLMITNVTNVPESSKIPNHTVDNSYKDKNINKDKENEDMLLKIGS